MEEKLANQNLDWNKTYDWNYAATVLGAIALIFNLSLIFASLMKGGYLALDGADTLCHLYRAQVVRESISQGTLYPLFDPRWYNGVEIMRYWGPLPLYLLAFIQYLNGREVIDSYPVFLSWIFFIGSCGWLCFGIRYRRVWLSAAIGFIWFFCPENIRITTTDGNVPRILINALLPWLLYAVWRYAEEKQGRQLIRAMLIMFLILLCHLGIALIVLSSILLLILLHSISRRNFESFRNLLAGFALVFLSAGLWLVPAMYGGAVANSDTNQVMQYFFQSIVSSLNPDKRMHGDMLGFYYGISLFVLGLAGAFLSLKKTRILFVLGLILFFCTGEEAYELFSQLPFSQFMWMIRFIPVSVAFVLMGFLLWDSLKKWLVLLLCMLLFLDCIPSVQYLVNLREVHSAGSFQLVKQAAEDKGLIEAKALTTQRLSLMDLSTYGSFAPYYTAGVAPAVNYVFGAGWEGAGTASNLVRLNSAMELGHYQYVFDRSLELGADVVSVPAALLKDSDQIKSLVEAGKQAGYLFVKNAEDHFIFQYHTAGNFGTVTAYRNLALGKSARDIAMMFPDFEEGDSNRLEDYSLEDLSKYEKIYLSGFVYESRIEAEKILTELARRGVKIFIDMNQISLDRETGSHQLFEVYTQPIAFTEGFPSLQYKGAQYQPERFSSDFSTWNTVYLDGVATITGRCEFQDKQIVFAGTDEKNQICFLGMNLIYHGILTADPEVTRMAEAIFEEAYGSMPKRDIVPVSIKNTGNRILIQTDRDGVNTSLAYLDIFYTEQKVENKNHFLVVPSGKTEIRLRYPYLLDGLALSVCGLLLMIIFVRFRILKDKSG